MNFKKREEFNQFLKSNNCWMKFFAYFKFLNKGYKDIDDYLKDVEANDVFVNAFNWSFTDEGTAYWDKLNNKWRESIKKRVLYFVVKKEIPDNIEDKDAVSLINKVAESNDIQLVDCKVIYE